KTPKDLILYLMKNKDKLKYSEDAILKALSEVVAANNVPGIAVPPETTTGKKGFTWLPWVIILSCLFLFFFFKRKKDKDKKKK
ncbi:MAG TPA: LPXTG cell wall anchor domain-containing protein, partial [Bacteroidales bacterium]|nr:LPXTG cell wall anchor domain-containing protein [Bacteroidales bacterium]